MIPNPNAATGAAASWTGLSNYLLYDINDCWGFGLRYEYFEDLDGAVVPGVGLGRSSASPRLRRRAGFQVQRRDDRPELEAQQERRSCGARFAGTGPQNSARAGTKPFDDGSSNSQFLWGNDVVVRF